MVFTCHYCLISLIWGFQVRFCLWWLCHCAHLLSVSESQPSVVHSFSASSLAINGGVRYLDRRSSITPTVVRRGQTDWLRRLLCGNLGGTSRAWDIILRHPTLLGPLGSPPLQHCIAPCSPCQSGSMYCGPAEMMAWSVW